MAFPQTPLDLVVELAIGADLSADPGTWSWTDVSVREGAKVSITRGRRGRTGHIATTRCTATADNTDGDLCRHNPYGQYFGQLRKNTPMRVRVDNGSGYVTRAAVFVPGFPPTWDPTGSDQTVVLNGVGLFDRMGRGKVLKSAPRRYLERLAGGATEPAGAWLLEDGALVATGQALYGREAMSPFRGRHPSGAAITYPQWGTARLAPWLPAVAGRSSSTLTALVTRVSMPGFTDTWTVDHAYSGNTDAPTSTVDVNPSYLGGAVGWPQLTLNAGDQVISVSFNALPEVSVDAPNAFDGLVHHIRWTATQNGSDVDWEVYLDGTLISSDTVTSFTLPEIDGFGLVSEAGTAPAIGYVAAYTDPPAVADAAAAVLGHPGEMAHERFERLCAELNIPATTAATTSQLMGPQGVKRALDLLRECGDADVALLYENMDFGLTFVSSSERRNLAAAITLAYDQEQILPPFQPEDDDQGYYNSIVATRPNGGQTVLDDDDEVEAVGEYGDTVNPNVYGDDQLPHVGGMQLGIGRNDELTWSAVTPNVAVGGSLLDDWLACDLGQGLFVTGHPAPLAPDTIRQIIEGYTETIGSFEFRPTVILSPASVWDVGEYGSTAGTTSTKYGAKDSYLETAVDDNDTALRVHPDVTVWATTASHPGAFDIPLELGGLVYECSAISGPAFVAAGTAAHADNASVSPGLPAGAAAGDLLLIWAAIRSSGTGTVSSLSGWTSLLQYGNTRLFGKVHSGSESAPTVTFSGGSAGDSTSAQMCAFRRMSTGLANLGRLDTVTQLNSSSQDIATPALVVPTNAAQVLLHLAWKQDDWTSVLPPTGSTEIGEPDTVTGNDQGISWAYTILARPINAADGSFTVTGGGAAISRAAVVSLAGLYEMTVTRLGTDKSHAAGIPIQVANQPPYGL